MRVTLLDVIWKEERGPADVHCHIFAASSTQAYYFRHDLKVFFASTEKPLSIVPVLSVTSHPSLRILQPFNSPLSLEFAISGLDSAPNPEIYKI